MGNGIYNRWEIAYADGSTPLATPDLPVDDQPNDGHDDQQQSRQADNERNFGRLVVLLPLHVSITSAKHVRTSLVIKLN